METWELLSGVLAGLLGYLAATFAAGKKERHEGRFKSLEYKIGKRYLHIHHWFWSFVLIVILIALRFWQAAIYGLFLGVMLQGFSYKDFPRFFFKKPVKKHNQEI